MQFASLYEESALREIRSVEVPAAQQPLRQVVQCPHTLNFLSRQAMLLARESTNSYESTASQHVSYFVPPRLCVHVLPSSIPFRYHFPSLRQLNPPFQYPVIRMLHCQRASRSHPWPLSISELEAPSASMLPRVCVEERGLGVSTGTREPPLPQIRDFRTFPNRSLRDSKETLTSH